ncbi:HSP20-like chaperone [Xylaria cf. heliscus]|nr:HSP20-like chaperone [Xylaria cf. heliscus]
MDNSNNNNNNNNPQALFWDFVRSFDPNGGQRPGPGVDHSNPGPQFPEGFPFDATHFGPSFGSWRGSWGGPWGGPWGGHMGGHRGRRGHSAHHHHHDRQYENDDSGDEDSHGEETVDTDTTMRNTPEAGGAHPPPPPPPHDPFHPPPPSQDPFHPPPPPHDPFHQPPPPHGHHPHGPPPPFGPPRGRGGRCGRGGRRHRPPPPAYSGPFDFRPLMHALSAHPFAHAWRNYADQYRARGADATAQQEGQTQEKQDGAFVPPVDVFSTEKAYVLHVAVPGVAKENVDVSWDGDKVRITGVVHRPGDEEFLSGLVSSERKVGMFERSIKLPPPGSSDNEDVDGFGITAKMENGILIVTVPKAEKDWTEVHKVEIE